MAAGDPQICTGFVTRPGRCGQKPRNWRQNPGNRSISLSSVGFILFSFPPFQWYAVRQAPLLRGCRGLTCDRNLANTGNHCWTDGYRFTGVAITLWLLILSVVIGGFWRCFWRLVASRIINTSSFNLWLLIFFAVRRYVQLLVFYSACTLEIGKEPVP